MIVSDQDSVFPGNIRWAQAIEEKQAFQIPSSNLSPLLLALTKEWRVGAE